MCTYPNNKGVNLIHKGFKFPADTYMAVEEVAQSVYVTIMAKNYIKR